ncbi:uncharacterized protein BCR38DRAFT_43771 [Pseudomassariella vexata]|uniref:SWI-SNF chromatin-remodeling complex protein n=1 Tax=Pseudomassariella vexata TaxID=1141098 RepID=A0A1Y2DND2_9PEZI|nr:uncharacterized protein BCR38DRAFT_43771 [Pseudomassariella vexata]ORY60646.1 hypothetical protein BCR38DRAFT_43771 [Pseudomassariella vexata]
MADGTYQNIYRGGSPMTPSTPSSAYQPNINRTKTRKWVEAKVQSYDGDDWGNEYDDDKPNDPDEPPPPPLNNTRPYQPGQNVNSASARTFSQPAASTARGRIESTDSRSPSGPPALHLQTQQSTPVHAPAQTTAFATITKFGTVEAESATVSDPSSLGSASERGAPEQLVSWQSADMRPFAPPEAIPLVQPEYQPQSAGAGSSRFPPRKSSMSQQDQPGSRSGSRPGSSSSTRPWMGQRSNSPGQSAASGAVAKSPHFIRPADIYRRMDEEREKERRSMESSRASMDSMPGADRDNNLRSPIEQRRRPSLDKDDGSDTARSLKPTLPPVAERHSEYGVERLIDESQTRNLETASRPAGGAMQTTATTVPGKYDGRSASTSLKLPDVARMSGFGDDFFSSSGLVNDAQNIQGLATELETQSHYYVEPQDSGAVFRGPSATPLARGTEATVQTSGGALTQPTEPLRCPVQPETCSHDSATDAFSTSATSGARSSSSPKHQQVQHERNRPSIPGGWVSETTKIGSEAPTPMERSEIKSMVLSPVHDTEVSPVTDTDGGSYDMEPTTTVKHAQSLDIGHEIISKVQAKHEACSEGFGEAAGKHDQDIADEVTSGEPGQHPTHYNLPTLQTETTLAVAGQPSTREGAAPSTSEVRSPPVSYEDSPTIYSAKTRTPTASDFTPTAPLQPRRSETGASEFTAPGIIPRNPTMSSIDTASPANESDRLREDIMKSLSPVDGPDMVSAGSLLGLASNKSGPNEMTRESRYLSGVYDDYLGPTEEKSLRETSQARKDEPQKANHQISGSAPSQHNTGEQTSDFVIAPSQLEKGPEPASTNRPRRFSWEQGPEDVSLSPVDEPKGSFFGSQPPRADAKSPVSMASAVDSRPGQTTGPELYVEPDGAGTMSHQVSQVSSRATEGLGTTGFEPPSPISVMSAEKSPKLANQALENGGRRLSVADEKALIQASSQSVSPSPPQNELLAFSNSPGELSPETPTPTAMPAASASQQAKVMSWKDILSIPSPELRIERFEDARVQFASMDSGLVNWILHMKSQPEHADAPVTPGFQEPGIASHMQAQPSPTGGQSSTQQPYYQQYLNASNPNIAAPPPPARASTGNLNQGQASSSGFGGGTKSKELLHAAGMFGNKATKSGMKLFAKGKSKLRSTGDKEQPGRAASPPRASQAANLKTRNGLEHLRNERRSRWGTIVSAFRGPQCRPGHSSSLSLGGRGHPSSVPWLSIRSRAHPKQAEHNASHKSKSETNSTANLPQLPHPSAISPFEHDHSSPWLPPRAPRLPENSNNYTYNRSHTGNVLSALRYPLQPELVSPISETTTTSSPPAPTHRPPNRDLEPHHRQSAADSQLQISAPIGKRQPTGDRFTWTPLVEEEGFDFDPPVTVHRPAPLPLRSAATSPTAHHVPRLTTDYRSDGWVEVIAPKPIAPPNPTPAFPEPHSQMLAHMAPEGPNVPMAEQYMQQHEEEDSSVPARQPSFIGLPPIRRTSTFALSGRETGQGDDYNLMPSPVVSSEDEAPPMPSMPAEYRGANTNGRQLTGPTPMDAVQSPQESAQPSSQSIGHLQQTNGNNGYGPPMQPAPNGFMNGYSHGTAQAPEQSGQTGHQTTGRSGPAPGGPQSPYNQPHGHTGSPPMQGQQFNASETREQPGMDSPQAAGNPIHRFPPQGQWKLKESHLSEPLAASRNRSSTGSPPAQQPVYYAYDKETEVQSPVSAGSSSQPSNLPLPLPRQMKNNKSTPPVSAERFPSPFPAEAANQPRIPQEDQIQPEVSRQDSMGSSKTSSHEIDNKNERHNSGLFKETGGRLSMQRSRDSISDKPGVVHSDDVSDTSVAAEDLHETRKRGFSFGLENALGNSGARQDRDSFDLPAKPAGAPQFGQPEKKKSFFGAGVLSKQKSNIALGQSETSGMVNEPNNSSQSTFAGSAPAPMKKRLSELKGLFKGSSTKDDHQPVKTITQQPTQLLQQPIAPGSVQGGQPMQGASRPGPHDYPAQGGGQLQLKMTSRAGTHPGQPVFQEQGPPKPNMTGPRFGTNPGFLGQSGPPHAHMMGPPSAGQAVYPGQTQPQPTGILRLGQSGQPPYQGHPGQLGPHVTRQRSETQGSGQPSLIGASSIAESQKAGEGRKSGGGGFLSGLFGKRPESQAKESQPQPQPQYSQQMLPRGQFPMQPGQQFHPGPGQPTQNFAPRIMYGFPNGHVPPGQGPMMAGSQVSQGQIQQFPPAQQPGQPGQLGPPGQGAQGGMVAIRRPSQTNVPMHLQPQASPNERPIMPSQQGSQTTMRPDEHELRHPLSSNPVNSQATPAVAAAPATSPHLSQNSSQERLSIAGSSIGPRVSPSRKPVGSGSARQASISLAMVSSAPAAGPKNKYQLSEEAGRKAEPDGNEQQLSTQAPPIRTSSQLGSPDNVNNGHMRQPSLPTPSPSPAPHGSSPRPELQRLSPLSPHQQSLHPLGTQISPLPPAAGGFGLTDRQLAGQAIGPAQGPLQVGQQTPGGPGQPEMAPGQLLQSGPNAQQPWPVPTDTNMSGPQGQEQTSVQWRPQPASLHEQKSSVSRFFGGGKRRESSSPQPSNSNPSAPPKESTSSKLLGAFKRSSKQPDANRPQRRTSSGQQLPPHLIQDRGQMPSHMTQNGRGMIPGQPMPQGPLGSFGPSPAPGHPQGPQIGLGVPPSQMQNGRGMPPMMQGTNSPEPQYDQVPIPMCYQPVRGYGGPSDISASPYGQQQYQPTTQLSGSPPQQWDPRIMPPQQATPPNGQWQMLPQRATPASSANS